MQSEDSVTSFLSQVDEQEKKEKEEREKQEHEDDMRQRQFEKEVMYGEGENPYPANMPASMPASLPQQDSDSGSSSFEGSSSPSDEGSATEDGSTPAPKIKKAPVVEDEMPEDNPISAMMALKHPETVKAVEDASINEMAMGYRSAGNRFVDSE